VEDASQSAGLENEDASSMNTSEQEDNSTTRNTASGEKEGSTSSSQVKIGKAETTAVNRSKMVVYVCLIIFSLATSIATYFYVANEENSDFETAVSVGTCIVSTNTPITRIVELQKKLTSYSPLYALYPTVLLVRPRDCGKRRQECRTHLWTDSWPGFVHYFTCIGNEPVAALRYATAF
jgi:hypothetical protein